jgi:phosphoribosylamine---glycine ligase
MVVGSGGREHALLWKLAQSERVGELYAAPGNAGTARIATNVPVAVDDISGLVDFARAQRVDLTVVGPDDALAAGLVDALQASGLRAFGPVAAAARIESSKAFAKQLMRDAAIPTAHYAVLDDLDKALAHVRSRPAPMVVKASGLALGKGVIVCRSHDQASAAVRAIMADGAFGSAGAHVVVEDFLQGEELSLHALSDGHDYRLFPGGRDHKPIGDGDTGPNTGGMGTVVSTSWRPSSELAGLAARVVEPALAALASQGTPFRGLLYPGLMLTSDGPQVLEFNARFGDPETQSYMRLLDTDVFELLDACASGRGRLADVDLRWKDGYAVCIVLAAAGYPGSYERGVPLAGLDAAERTPGVVVFHAGTAEVGGELVSRGGRVLNVTAVGATLEQALNRAYASVARIDFPGMQYRRDIGRVACADTH